MNLTALLLITLSGNGHWLGGHTETIEVQWAVKQPIPGATLAWRLVCGDAELASGRLALPAGNRPGIIRLALPPVRVQTAMHLIYRAEQAGKSTRWPAAPPPWKSIPTTSWPAWPSAWPGSNCWFGTLPTGCRRC